MPALILIPGLVADADMWQDQLNALPLHWRSSVTDVHHRYDRIETMARGLLNEYDGPLVLCGASMGGIVAMEAARQAPKRISGLALLGTSAQTEPALQRRHRENALQMLKENRLTEFVRASAPFVFSPERNSAHKELTRRYRAMVLRAPVEQWLRQNQAMMDRPDARPGLSQLRCPTLVVCGASDLLTPPELSHEIAHLAFHAELHLIHNCGHMLTMEQPHAVNALLTDWLERHWPRI